MVDQAVETPTPEVKKITCPDCGMEVDQKAVYCPKCDFPIAYDRAESRREKLKARKAEERAKAEAEKAAKEKKNKPARRGAFDSFFGGGD